MFALSRNRPRRQRGRPLAGAAVLVTLWLAQSAALAQTPYVPEEWKYGKRQDGAALNYCVDERDPDLPVAKEIGRAVAQALLLQNWLVALCGFAGFGILFFGRIGREERLMLETFGEQYDAFARRTKRLVPWIY